MIQEFDQHDEEHHEEQPRGWYFPIEIIHLYKAEIINAEEVMLLGTINSLVRAKKGCIASNPWLAKHCNKTPRHIQKLLEKFKELGLIRVTSLPGNRRRIHVTYHDFEHDSQGTSKMTHRYVKNDVVGTSKMTCPSEVPREETKENGLAGAKPRVSFGLDGEPSNNQNDPSSILCRKLAGFVLDKGLNKVQLKNNKVIATKLRVRDWKILLDDFLYRTKASPKEVANVMDYYFENFNKPYFGLYACMAKFLEKYPSLRKRYYHAHDLEVPDPNQKRCKVTVIDVTDENYPLPED